MVFFQLEPFGPTRDNMHAAMITAMIAEANRDREARPEPFSVDEFMLRVRRKKRKTPEQIAAAFRTWAVTMKS